VAFCGAAIVLCVGRVEVAFWFIACDVAVDGEDSAVIDAAQRIAASRLGVVGFMACSFRGLQSGNIRPPRCIPRRHAPSGACRDGPYNRASSDTRRTMSEIVDSVTQCDPIPGTDRIRITLAGTSGFHTYELTQSAVEAILPGLIGQAPVPGKATAVATAITPIGCQPFESKQGLCGLAFNLGDRYLHIGVPPNGVEQVRLSLDNIQAIYEKRTRSPYSI
jgi:hypothetical protein